MPNRVRGTKKSQSSLVMRFVNNDFQENKEPTIGGMQPSRMLRA
jgi:hypothetical protein